MTAILAILSAIATAAANAVGWIIETMPPVGWLLLAVLLIGLYVGHGCNGVPSGCSLRELACGCRPREPRPERTHLETGTIGSWTSAVQGTLIQEGRRGRIIERPFTLRYVASDGSPAAMTLSEQLAPVGSSVTIEAVGGRILGDEGPDAQDEALGNVDGYAKYPGLPQQEPDGAAPTIGETTDAQGAELEAHGPIIGTVQNANGQDCGLELVSKGLATVGTDAPKAYQDAMKQAKKSK